MAKIPASGSVVQSFRGGSRSLLSRALMGALVLALLAASVAQAQNIPAGNSIGKNKPSPSVSPATVQEVDIPPDFAPPPPVTAEQQPPRPPTVAWDGKLLTIDADNSTLAAVLVAVRERTGASIEIPGAASAERVFVHLGPGPARDILSDLLYGTPFDYIVEAADDDPDTLRKVVLTARGLGDGSSDVVVAGAASPGDGSAGGSSTLAADAPRSRATEPLAHPERARMMPGWSSSGKPTSQAEAEAALAAQQAAKEEDSAAAHDHSLSQESAAQDSVASEASRPAPDPAAAENSVTAVHAAEDTASNSSPSTSDSNDQSAVGQAIQNMNRMFEQRRQLQAQQNQPPRPSSN